MFFLMIRRPPISTRTDTLFPYTTLFRSKAKRDSQAQSDRLSGIAAPSLMHSGWMTGNHCGPPSCSAALSRHDVIPDATIRSEEHTSELQSLIRISYAVFCLKQNTQLKSDNIITLRHTH